MPVVRAKGSEILSLVESGQLIRSPVMFFVQQNKDKMLKITIELDT